MLYRWKKGTFPVTFFKFSGKQKHEIYDVFSFIRFK